MEVDRKNAAATAVSDGETFYFCSDRCRNEFVKQQAAEHSHDPRHHHSEAETASAAAQRRLAKKYFCPMCEGVESDTPGSCRKCGMALERNPTFRESTRPSTPARCIGRLSSTIPEIARSVVAGDEEDNAELVAMSVSSVSVIANALRLRALRL